MSKKWVILFILLIAFSFLLRIIPTLGNNFYFTMDQGNDGVHVREIINHGRILLLGPVTGIPGLYAGVGWYYFISIGYFIFGGHPFGALFMIILLNTFLTGLIVYLIGKEIGWTKGFLLGFFLQFYWYFFESSRYAFNPFPLVTLSFLLIYFLSKFWQTKNLKYYTFAVFPIGAAFHFEVAGTIAFLIFFLLSSIFFLLKKKISFIYLLKTLIILFLFFIPHIISEIGTDFSQTHTFFKQLNSENIVFGGTNLFKITQEFSLILSKSVFVQNYLVGVLIFIFIIGNYLFQNIKKKNFTFYFILFTFILFITSLFWFSTNKGWYDWQTIYLPTLLFIAIILTVFSLPKKLSIIFLLIIFSSQFIYFSQRYSELFKPNNDPSILKNELAAIDWVYEKSEGKGFYVYNYLPSVEDYPYQYLIWWHGLKQYGYLSCEYASFPNSPKLFVPGSKYYQEPKKECTNLRFLIIEPDKNNVVKASWYQPITEGTSLLESIKIGGITVEKRVTREN